MEIKTIEVKARTLPDAWFQLLYRCIDLGREFIIDQGSYAGQKRLEFDYVTAHISHPGELPLLPRLPEGLNIPDPVDDNYLADYLPYLMTGELKEGESYTYGQRLCANELPFNTWPALFHTVKYNNILIQDQEAWEISCFTAGQFNTIKLSQIDLLIWTYKNKGHRNNQMVLQVAQPTDMLLQDPPCLRHIDTRIQDGQLHFFPYFRSWDLFGGFPANLAAIRMLQEHCAGEIGVEPGEIVASSKGLHIYDHLFEIAEMVRGKSIGEFREEMLEMIAAENKEN